MKTPRFRRIIIDQDVADLPVARSFAAYARSAGIALTFNHDGRDGIDAGHTLSTGKRVIHVTRHRGAAVKRCTGFEPHQICCNLRIMNQTTNCPLDCSYCILQAYLNQPVTTVCADIDDMMTEVEAYAACEPRRLVRIGTGDLADALALDPIGHIAFELVPRFATLANVVLELKTKSDAVEQLLGLPHSGRVVASWSVNPQGIIETDEHLCASLAERLIAATKVVDNGYLVAFHFDPIVAHPGWEDAYREVVCRVFDAVPAERVAFISMGSLRFPAGMRGEMARRFPGSKLLTGELVLASDGKVRYLRPLRLRLYRKLLKAIRECGGAEVFTYLCMETPTVWRQVMGKVPASSDALDFAFASSLVRRFPYLMPESPRWEDYVTLRDDADGKAALPRCDSSRSKLDNPGDRATVAGGLCEE